jgi:tellurite resistance protein TerC
MNVPTWVWLATVAGLGFLLALDLIIVDRKPHTVGMAESIWWVVFYLGCAVAFGLGVWLFAGSEFAVEFAAGYLTEYSL